MSQSSLRHFIGRNVPEEKVEGAVLIISARALRKHDRRNRPAAVKAELKRVPAARPGQIVGELISALGSRLGRIGIWSQLQAVEIAERDIGECIQSGKFEV